MSTRSFLAELRRRGVLKVAVAYAAIGWVVLEVLSQLFENFDAPGWVIKVVTTLVIVGFPVACLMSWGFDITPEGVRPVPPMAKSPPVPPAIADSKEAVPVEAAAPPSIAVLPFEDMSAEHDQQYLGDGIAEELLNALAAVEGLKVAARTSAFSFRGRGATMKEVGEVLHVRHVLEGSVRRSGQKLRVTAQLVDVVSGFHLFSQAYDRELVDIFDIQNDIARQIASALLPRLGLAKDAMLVSHGTQNLEAYNLRLKAHQLLVNPDPLTVGQPMGQLRQAIALDPAYADAWGDLAYLQLASVSWQVDPVPAVMESYRSATVALDHAPENVPALLVLAFVSMVVHRDASAAARYLAKAKRQGIDLSVWAFSKAVGYEGPLGRCDEGLRTLEEALAKDPLAPNLHAARVWMLQGAGRHDEAAAAAEAALPLAGRAPMLFVVAARANVAAANIGRARELLEAAGSTSAAQYPGYMPQKIAAEVAAGNRAAAQSLLDWLLERGVDAQPSACYAIGEAYLMLDDFDRAIDWWTRSVERREPWSLMFMPALYRGHPVIGKDPRFHALLRRMGLE